MRRVEMDNITIIYMLLKARISVWIVKKLTGLNDEELLLLLGENYEC